MNISTREALDQFDKSLSWNALLYFTYKISATLTSFILFKKLTTSDFSIWANINSIVFLVLLWMDFGFRKSIPKYAQSALKGEKSHANFIKFIIILQLALMLMVCGCSYFFSNFFVSFFNITKFIFYLAFLTFLTEAPIAFLKLVHHAHFWNKEFNLLNAKVIGLEIILNLVLVFLIKNSHDLLVSIIITKIVCGIFLNILGVYSLIKLYRQIHFNSFFHEEFPSSDFVKHSFMMWLNTALKSLSERNFLVPVLTYGLGPGLANIFKIANDWALLFQRSVLKTIGTSDTSLLAYAQIVKEQSQMAEILKKLFKRVAALCLPFLGILIIFILNKNLIFKNDKFVFQIFLILVICYLIESMLTPFERILEVKKYYLSLLIAHLPFSIFLILLKYKTVLPLYGLLYFVLLLCSVRMLSFAIICYSVKISKL